MYINIKTQEQVYSFKSANISFPNNPTEEMIALAGYATVLIEEMPVSINGRIITKRPITEVNGIYTQAWDIDDTNVDLEMDLRQARGVMLNNSDWTHASDSTKSVENKEAWATYRQELRDLPAKTTDFEAIVWPISPATPDLGCPLPNRAGIGG